MTTTSKYTKCQECYHRFADSAEIDEYPQCAYHCLSVPEGACQDRQTQATPADYTQLVKDVEDNAHIWGGAASHLARICRATAANMG